MADNSYAQLIDDYENGILVEPGETLTQYIDRMGGVDYKADGGSIGIEVLFTDKMKNGGRVPMVSGGALKAIGSGIMKMFSKGDDALDLSFLVQNSCACKPTGKCEILYAHFFW